MHAKSNLQIAVLVSSVAVGLILLDGGQCQDQTGGGGLRFPNLFGGLNNPFSLSNLFRQQRQPQNQVPPPSPAFSSNPQFSLVGGQLSPVGGGPNNFLQVPPLTFQQPGQGQPFNSFVPNPQGVPLQQQFAQPQPIGTQFIQQHPAGQFAGPPQQQPLQISQPSDLTFQAVQPQLTPVASGFTPSIAFQPPQAFNSNNLVPNILPIGNIPLQPHPTQIQQQPPHQHQQLPHPQQPPQQQQPQQLQQQAPKPHQQPIVPSLPGPPAPQQIAPNPSAPPVLLPAQFALSSNTLQQQHHQQRHFLRQGKTISPIHRDSAASGSSQSENVIDCGAGNDLGFCATSEKYPRSVVDDTMHRCHDQVNLMYAEVPEDYEALGDSHQPAGVGAGQEGNSTGKNPPLPWSWSSYRKESACDSELRFIQPHVAQDRLGRWRIIIQTPEFPQRVAIDVCRRVDDVCKVFTDCGRKSRCVQRYSYQPLISLDQDKRQAGQCPSMAVFRFPTSCVCHVEVDKRSQTVSKSNRRNSVAIRRP